MDLLELTDKYGSLRLLFLSHTLYYYTFYLLVATKESIIGHTLWTVVYSVRVAFRLYLLCLLCVMLLCCSFSLSGCSLLKEVEAS